MFVKKITMENSTPNSKKTWITPEIFNESIEETEGKITHPYEGGPFGPS
jgi:hypothetical protein